VHRRPRVHVVVFTERAVRRFRRRRKGTYDFQVCYFLFFFLSFSRLLCVTDDDGVNFLLFYSIIIHRRMSITRAENGDDSASTTTPAAAAAPKLVPSNAASIKVSEFIRLEKFFIFCFSRSKCFFSSSLAWGRSCLSLSSLLSYNSQKTTKVRLRDFL